MDKDELFNCEIKLRDDPQRRKDRVYVGCGAGFGGDRPSASHKLLRRVKQLDYLVLECLAERTLADRYKLMMSGGKGFDPRSMPLPSFCFSTDSPKITDWMRLLLPLAVERGVCIITNMGAMDPLGAQRDVLDVARNLGLEITVSVAYEVPLAKPENSPSSSEGSIKIEGGMSTYLGAAPIVYCLEKYKPDVVITSRVADAALFLAPMVYELGWNWNDYDQLAQGSLAGHLLECGCQLTGGYFMHPGSNGLNKAKAKCHFWSSNYELLDLSLPFAEVSFKGEVCVAKADGSGGVLNFSICAEQLLYEVGDPGRYITPDLVIDFSNVNFRPISDDRVVCHGAKPSNGLFPEKLLQLVPMDCGWKGWGEISYGGHGCVRRAQAAEYLVRSWMEEAVPGVKDRIISYIVGYDSLKTRGIDKNTSSTEEVLDVRLRMDGLFELEDHAIHFAEQFIALYTNGPAGGGGISTGHKKEMILQKELVDRKNVFWRVNMKQTRIPNQQNQKIMRETGGQMLFSEQDSESSSTPGGNHLYRKVLPPVVSAAAPANKMITLYQVAHSRAGDKGNDLNFSIIPHFPNDVERLKKVITPDWVKNVVSALLHPSPFPEHKIQQMKDLLEQVRVEIYDVPGVHSLNVVVRNILDGGVNCSRRIDRHGKTISDLILYQEIVLPA